MNSFLSPKLFIVATLLFAAINVSAQGTGSLEYSVSNGSATIIGFTSEASSVDLVVPEVTGENVPVTAIADGVFSATNTAQKIKSVTFEGANLKTIGSNAFAGCNLSELVIPSSVVSVGLGAFANNTNLKKVTFEGTSDGDITCGDGAFFNNPQLTQITLPSNLKKIGKWCFAFCDITKIDGGATTNELPSSITEIDSFAFAGNKNLTSITIPASVTTFGEGAFWCCFKLSVSVATDNTVLTMGEGNDEGVLFNNDKTTLYFFPNTPLMTRKYQYMVPKSVTRIGAGAFGLDKSTNQIVTAVILPTHLESIGDLAFNSCPFATTSPIQHLTIPNNTTTLGYGCLSNGLQDLVILCISNKASTFVSQIKKAFTTKTVTIGSTSMTCGGNISNVAVYTRKTAYSTISGMFPDNSTISSNNSIDSVRYNIPITLPAEKKFVSLSRDFPILAQTTDLLNTATNLPAAKFFVAENDNTDNTKSTVSQKKITVAEYQYIPARGDNEIYMGIIVSAPNIDVSTEDRTLYYQIGTNNDYDLSAGSDYDESEEGRTTNIQQYNMLMPAPCPTLVRSDTVHYTVYSKTGSSAVGQDGYTSSVQVGYTYGLKNNLFKKISSDGYVKAQKCYMALDTDLVEGDNPPQAKALLEIVFEDSNTTGINNVSTEEKKDTNKWFTLQGVSLSEEPTQPGIYIHNGKKIIVR